MKKRRLRQLKWLACNYVTNKWQSRNENQSCFPVEKMFNHIICLTWGQWKNMWSQRNTGSKPNSAAYCLHDPENTEPPRFLFLICRMRAAMRIRQANTGKEWVRDRGTHFMPNQCLLASPFLLGFYHICGTILWWHGKPNKILGSIKII